jgi:Isochorismatase family
MWLASRNGATVRGSGGEMRKFLPALFVGSRAQIGGGRAGQGDPMAKLVANARHLLDAVEFLGVPALFTEQNTGGLGPTVPELRSKSASLFHKMMFDACRMPGFLDTLPGGRDLVLAGCETHVCVLQTALGLIAAGRRVIDLIR